MSKVYFVRKWSDKGKDITWSGTPSGILKALQEKLNNNVEMIDLDYDFLDRVIVKGTHALLKALSIDGCDVPERYIEGHIANRYLKTSENKPVIAFAECKTTKTKDTYLFIDCSVDYAYRCHMNKVEFAKYVPFGKQRNHSLLAMRNKNATEFYRKCKGIFTMGQWLADDLSDCTGIPSNKIHCVGGGTNVPVNLIDSSKKIGNKFLFVGKDFERKNGKLVVDAFQILNNRHNGQYELYIAGPKEWPLEKAMPEGVHFLGLKNTKELAEYYNLCDVFVMPSRFEAYGLVFAEALIYGLPIIGRDAFAMRDFVKHGENGYLLKTDSAEELAVLMESAILNDELRKRVISNRERYIEQYSWQSVVKRMLDTMRQDGYDI